MSDKKIMLSISMLISGREEMQKSLESLRPFQAELPCEVILVDTGCNAAQRELAEQYADKIISFQWCDDFAAARNAGLKAARGEWFLYLDDDEWFEDPKEIIDFFRTGEYRNYNSASYVVRNYRNEEGTFYNESYPSRMERLDKEAKFAGKIHEYLLPFRQPQKVFSTFVHHYGYVFKNREEEKKHSARNLPLLSKMRKEEPGNPRWILQLAQEYFFLEEYDKSMEAAVRGLEEWKSLRKQIEYAPTHVGATYAYILISLDCLQKYEEEKKWLKKALEDRLTMLEYMKPTVAFYCAAGARLYARTKEYKTSRDYFARYFKYLEELGNNRIAIEQGTAAVTDEVFQEQFIYGTILICMQSLICSEDYSLAEKAFYRLDWSDRRLLQQTEWETAMLEACCSVPYHSLWKKMMQTLIAREDGMKEMYVVFLQTEFGYEQRGELIKRSRLRRLVSELESTHRYVLYTKILWEAEKTETGSTESREKIEALFRQLIEKCPGEILWVRDEVWKVAERLEIPVEQMLLSMDFTSWKRSLEQWGKEASLEEIRQWEKRLHVWKGQDNIRFDYAAMKCKEYMLLHYREVCPEGFSNQGMEELEQMLWQYADSVLDYYRPLFRESVFENMTESLPDEARLSLLLQELRKYREQEDDKEILSCLRKCLGLYPALESVIEDYAKRCRDSMQSRTQEEADAVEEFASIVKSLKEAARLQIEKKKYREAGEILRQLQQCVPEDEEVKELLNENSVV